MTRAEAFNRIQELNRRTEKTLAAHDTINEFILRSDNLMSKTRDMAEFVNNLLIAIAESSQKEVQQLTMKHYGDNS